MEIEEVIEEQRRIISTDLDDDTEFSAKFGSNKR